jgi:hypothetical protein
MNNTKTIKKSQLMEIIQSIVRDTLQEKKDKTWIQKAVNPKHAGYCTPMTKSTCTPRRKALAKRFKSGDIHQDNLEKEGYEEQVGGNVVAEVAPPGFGPDKTHADIYNKLMKQYKGEPQKAYATMWKIHNKMDEAKNSAMEECGMMDEAGLTSESEDNEGHEHSEKQLIAVLKHVVGKLQNMHKGMEEEGMEEDITEKKDKWIGKAVDSKHKGYCTPMTKSTCTPRRKALAKRFKRGLEEMADVCDEWINEASYKVVSPRSYQIQSDNQALTVQTEPEVNEAAYKVQGRSYRVHADSPQFPDANTPENA